MYESLQKHLAQYIDLTPDEFEQLKTFFTPRTIRKKQYLLRAGEECKQVAFVEKGLLRLYTVDAKGIEHIVQFALEGWWISDLYSFLTGEPSLQNIDALETSELLLADRPSWEKVLERIPKFERYYRFILENNYIATHRRVVSNLSQTAAEKYEALLKTYPALAQRVPQHMIASYLGITPAFLSRLRSRKTPRKP